MSSRKESSAPFNNHERAAELHDNAAHEHQLAAQQAGKQDHETGTERSRRALEHSRQAYVYTELLHDRTTNNHGFTLFGRDEIAALAYKLWQDRGQPVGSPETDWLQAAAMLRSGK